MTIYLLHRPDPASAPMAHIANCLMDSDTDDLPLNINNYIAKAVSPQNSNESVCNHFNPPSWSSHFLPLAKAYLFFHNS